MAYFKSKNIKVYPTARRGSYSLDGKNYIYDPEARLETEYNKVNHFAKTAAKSSYVIHYDETTGYLTCVIGGYYFEINTDVSAYNYFGIKTNGVTLVRNDIDNRNTNILINFTAADNSLDSDSGDFEGLFAATTQKEIEDAGATDFLQLYIVETITDGDTTTEVRRLNPKAFLVESVLLTGSGEASLVGKTNSDITGAYSVTLGEDNTNTGDYSFVYGKSNKNSKQNSVLFGTSIVNNRDTDKDNQVIFKGFNDYNFDDKFTIDDKGIIKIHTIATGNTSVFEINNTASLFKVNGAGSTTMQGSLNVNGGGSIKNKLTAGQLEVEGATALDSTLQVTGNSNFTTATFAGAVSIGSTLNVSDKLTAKAIETTEDLTVGRNITAKGTLIGPTNTYQLTGAAANLYGLTINNSELKLTTQKITLGNGKITIKENDGVLEIIC